MPLICWGAPAINLQKKALSVPLFNPISSPHGRVFFLAWFSFLCSFLSWYSMSSLLTVTIRRDLGLTENEVANSNIIAGVSSLLVRLVAGFACERWGPRYVLVAILWASALPCGLAGTAHGVIGLYFIRFFMGIAGGAFVPAQVWVTNWFDKSCTGTSTAFAAGWGDSGVGWTFFVMPAIFNALNRHHTERVAWRISFVIPCLILIAISGVTLMLCDDTPTGPWATRNFATPTALPSSHSSSRTFVNCDTLVGEEPPKHIKGDVEAGHEKQGKDDQVRAHEEMVASRRGSAATVESDLPPPTPAATAPPPLKQGLRDVACLPTLMLASFYAANFGASLALNSILVPWFMEQQPSWDQTQAGHWAATVGLLNLVSRPAGGVLSDIISRRFKEGRKLAAKKYWMCLLCFVQGCFGIILGIVNPRDVAPLIGLLVGYAFFMQAANGAVYALLPAINPHVNGLMGGAVGSAGNLGGVIFAAISRYSPFRRTIYIIASVSIVVSIVSAVVNPLPKKQRAEAERAATSSP